MILASKSPRRKEILEDMGFNLKIEGAEIEEISYEKELTLKIMDIARKKLSLLLKNIQLNMLLELTQ